MNEFCSGVDAPLVISEENAGNPPSHRPRPLETMKFDCRPSKSC